EGAALAPAEAAQDLLAELAVITRERPSDGRHMLLTVPRDWDPDPAVASAQLEALTTAPWVETEPISALVGAPDPGLDRGSLPLDLESGAEVAASELAQVRAALEERDEISTMLEDPESVLGDPELELLSAASAAWRSDPEARQASIAGIEAATATLRGAVAVVPGGDVNLISTSGELPIRVANTLDQAVDVRIGLRPGDSRLRSDDDVEVTIAADSEVTVALPVHGIQSADVAVAVEVRTPEGVVVDDSTVLTVRVRAEWESIGTAIIGALLAVGVVIGVVRTVRRGRRGTRGEPRVDSGPDDLSPEEHQA
ncbi:DUF6049 family protein, partial [Actinotalea sp. C106]|uniref:DUF6049 family protein n=1 Tax=Actinotalea sp. C106 TaxID=2908644 RepID=UPI0020276D45